MNWDYLQPVKIRFGKGRVSEVKDLAKEMEIKKRLTGCRPILLYKRSGRAHCKGKRRSDYRFLRGFIPKPGCYRG